MKMKGKMAQGPTGNPAATLVAILALMVILYVLFLPPNERTALLGESSSSSSSDSSSSSTDQSSSDGKISTLVNGTFVTAYPGSMDVIDVKEYEHTLPSFNLNSLLEPTALKKADSFSVRNGWFETKEYSTSFELPSIEKVQNPMITFNIKKAQGTITIKLNGQEIYSGSPDGTLTLNIEKSNLKASNTLSFSVSSVGIKFWTTNEYILEDFKVIADILDTIGLSAKSTFVISDTEKNNLKSNYLRFYADCLSQEKGKMDVIINGHEIYSSVVDCGIYQKVEFSQDFIRAGENNLVFQASGGSYLIDQVLLKTTLKEVIYPTYYFTIGKEDFKKIDSRDANISVYVEFLDNLDYKKADLIYNGHIMHIDQRERNFTKNVNVFARQGDNAIELIPKTRINVLKMTLDWQS